LNLVALCARAGEAPPQDNTEAAVADLSTLTEAELATLPEQRLPEHLAGSCEQRHGQRREMIERARTQIEETVCGATLSGRGQRRPRSS
jgi:hypothetical protein